MILEEIKKCITYYFIIIMYILNMNNSYKYFHIL